MTEDGPAVTDAIEQHTEIERKYDVDGGADLPDLSGLPGVRRVSPPVEVEQTATYFDTPDLRLLAAQVTLRRRTGGLDDGWHLKLPAKGDRRVEVRVALTEADDPPPELLDRVRVLVRDAVVAPSAELVTRRTVHRLLGDVDTLLAELCDDRVNATSRGSTTIERWREWELELVDGPAELLDRAEPVLCGAGARRATVSSKVGRVLAERLPPQPRWQDRRSVGTSPSVGELLVAYVAQHFARLVRQDQLLRSGDQDGVHHLRVAARRMRSALTTYTPILEPGAATRLREDLRWFGGVLSGARDAQVLEVRLKALAEEQPPHLVFGPVVERIGEELGERFRDGRAEADVALGGERYFRLLDHLEGFLDAPPFAESAHRSARKAAPALVQAELDRLRRRDGAYRSCGDSHDRDLALHEVRKAAKRLRYAAETVQPVFGARATKLAARAQALQELLGEHQDSVVGQAVLLEIGTRAHGAGENSLTFGRLHALETARADDLERRYPRVLAGLPHKDLRAWLRK